MTENKDIGKAALAIVMTIIIITVGAIVLDEFQDTIIDIDGQLTTIITNETGSVNSTVYLLRGANSSLSPFSYSLISVMNGTTNTYLNAANWTFDSSAGTIINATGNPEGLNMVNITYSFTHSEPSVAYNATSSGLGGMNTFADWIDIIIIMIVVGIVIGLVYGVFRYVGGGTNY